MDNIEILTWAMGGGFAATWMMMFWTLKRIDKLQDTITDMDRRLCRLEGAFSSKEFCVLKNAHSEKAQ